ncbi:hypothetical protein [Nonomuraea turcica]|uniref:hypothetical protein n=1 Tax=Nonomuraea sp. G32 TaxID=3067274 RepID=UPI00273C49E9|nr:hypothetical protein [Nonomuraea sp. G32]MDP4509637.1 hypothetical protein [Nonomuraea sp. G32]
MRRSIHQLLGLAAATAAIAIGVPAAATAANASEARHLDTTSQSRSFDAGPWGFYYSKSYEGGHAYARARSYVDGNGRIVVGGKLYDKRSPQRLCGYVQVRYDNFQPDDREPQYYSAKHCGSGYRDFRFSEFGANTADLRVCFTDAYRGRHLCGKWKRIYTSQGDA